MQLQTAKGSSFFFFCVKVQGKAAQSSKSFQICNVNVTKRVWTNFRFLQDVLLLLLKCLILLEQVFRTVKLRNGENSPILMGFQGPWEPLDFYVSFRNNKSSSIFGFFSQPSPLPIALSISQSPFSPLFSVFLHPLAIFVEKSFVRELHSRLCLLPQT